MESGVQSTSSTKGLKYDAGKNRLDLIPPEMIEGIGRIFTMGAEKYAPWNWRDEPLDPWRLEAAMLRHICARRKGEVSDPESGLDHYLHAAWNCLVLAYYEEKGL